MLSLCCVLPRNLQSWNFLLLHVNWKCFAKIFLDSWSVCQCFQAVVQKEFGVSGKSFGNFRFYHQSAVLWAWIKRGCNTTGQPDVLCLCWSGRQHSFRGWRVCCSCHGAVWRSSADWICFLSFLLPPAMPVLMVITSSWVRWDYWDQSVICCFLKGRYLLVSLCFLSAKFEAI